jgi:hypothetical protein
MSSLFQSTDSRQLVDVIKKLEERVSKLESALSIVGPKVSLQAGSSIVSITPMSVSIKSNDILLASSGKIIIQSASELKLKGSNITEN